MIYCLTGLKIHRGYGRESTCPAPLGRPPPPPPPPHPHPPTRQKYVTVHVSTIFHSCQLILLSCSTCTAASTLVYHPLIEPPPASLPPTDIRRPDIRLIAATARRITDFRRCIRAEKIVFRATPRPARAQRAGLETRTSRGSSATPALINNYWRRHLCERSPVSISAAQCHHGGGG